MQSVIAYHNLWNIDTKEDDFPVSPLSTSTRLWLVLDKQDS